jgi:hypothetical protein
MLDENDVVEAVCAYLEQNNFVVNRKLHTSERGIDIEAAHSGSDRVLYVEAKGGTSSRSGSNRYGKPYTKSQIFDRTAKGVYTLLQMHGKQTRRNSEFALAVPDTKWFREYLAPVEDAIMRLGLQMFLVDENKHVEELARPRELSSDLNSAYQQMAQEEQREAEALEWAEATMGDVAEEPLKTQLAFQAAAG